MLPFSKLIYRHIPNPFNLIRILNYWLVFDLGNEQIPITVVLIDTSSNHERFC